MNSSRPQRVCIVPEYPESLMTGGLQVQAAETLRALSRSGGPFVPEFFEWSVRAALPDVYHFVGFPPYLQRIAELIRQAGRPYVVTLLLGNLGGPFRLGSAAVRHRLKRSWPGRSLRGDAVREAGAVITLTNRDAEAARVIYGLEPTRLHVVGNGIGDGFFISSPAAWQREFGTAPFVLCVGAVQRRKNQLLLVETCNQLEIPVVLLGSVLPGEEEYAARVAAAAARNETHGGRWLRNLGPDDPLLTSAFAACRLFALLSRAETQPLSVLQAMAAARPVLLLRAGYTEEPPFSGLPTVATQRTADVARALSGAWRRATPSSLSREFTWDNVARRLSQIYAQVVADFCEGGGRGG